MFIRKQAHAAQYESRQLQCSPVQTPGDTYRDGAGMQGGGSKHLGQLLLLLSLVASLLRRACLGG